MIAPQNPANERERIDSLRLSNILDTTPEERFDRLTRIAKRLFGVPIALVSLVDTDRQWFKSRIGLEVCETPREISFCGHAILGADIFLVPDTLLDPRFFDNPLVTGAPAIRFYAGCPLRGPNGCKIGTLCIIDNKPRDFDGEERGLLLDLAAIAQQEIASLELATLDELTMLSNRRGFEALAGQALSVCKRLRKPASLLFFDLNGFKTINDTYGHAEGDRALMTFAEVLRKELRDSDVIGRIGGDEFVAVLTDSTGAQSKAIAQRLRQTLGTLNQASGRRYDIRCSVGQVEYDAERHASVASLLAEADSAMYVDKKASKAVADEHA